MKYISTSSNNGEVWGVGTYGALHSFSPARGQWETIESEEIFESIAVSADATVVWAIDIDGNAHQIKSESDDQSDDHIDEQSK